MKHNLRSIIILAALGIIFGCAGSSYAQTDGPITGGYGTADAKDKDVIAAAKYAVKKEAKKEGAKIKFVSINKAETQVVAGLNYRLCIKVEIKEKGKKTYVTKLIQTVVYKNLDQKLSLTSWKEDACRPEM
jgi:ABC-type glycerol-3-phosphate transport system substrate-binding protein